MKLNLNQEEKKALLAYLEAGEDCEKLSEKEWVMDLYQAEPPISLDLVFNGKSVFADGAEYLKYDEEMDGWYIAGPVETAEEVLVLLRQAGALGK